MILALGRFGRLRRTVLRIRDEPVVVLVHQLQDRIDQRLERVVVLGMRLGLVRFRRTVVGTSFAVVVIIFGIVPVDQGLDQLAAVQFVVVVRVVHFEVVELQLLFAHFARVDRDLHVLGNVLLLMLNVVRIQHLLRLPMVLLLLLLMGLPLGMSLLLLVLNRNLLLLLLLVLGLNRNLLLLVLGLLLLIVLLLGHRRLLLIVLLGLLVLLLLLVVARIDAGSDTLTECHRCKQRQG